MSSSSVNNPTKTLWLNRFYSSLRTVLACAIVGAVTLCPPAAVHNLLHFPAFSYVTTILIVSEASLGQVIKGCFCALYATVQVTAASVLALWLVGPGTFARSEGAAAAVALTAFVVALPRSTPLLAKRIAFGQAVIVYVSTVVKNGEEGESIGVVVEPVRVAASTGLGVVASLLAVLLPFPRLGYNEVKRTCRLYIQNASERLSFLLLALNAQDNQAASDLISKAKFPAAEGAKHLQSIREAQGGMKWERPHLKFLSLSLNDEVETPIRGMELALSSCHSFPIALMDDHDLKAESARLKSRIDVKLEQAKCLTTSDAITAPETTTESSNNAYPWWRQLSIAAHDDLPTLFFLYCMELLQGGLKMEEEEEEGEEELTKPDIDITKGTRRLQRTWTAVRTKRWNFAFKCSLSLGLAVLFGLMFNERNGYWSGLTIAISFVTERQATFTMANARAQGTAMGSVYGILCSFLFHGLVELRFLLVLPWIVFASFLRQSKMYGQAGGISAVIGALLILGRKNYGNPSEFAIARITEATIGLLCLVAVEIVLQPARAATLARTEIAWGLEAFRDCVEGFTLCTDRKGLFFSSTTQRDKQKILECHVDKLNQFVMEAEVEPNFWFLPFHATCYKKLLGSLRKASDLLLFVCNQSEVFSYGADRLQLDQKRVEDINADLELFRDKVGSTLKCLQKVISFEFLTDLEDGLHKEKSSCDIELGKPPEGDKLKMMLGPDEVTVSNLVNGFLQHLRELGDVIDKKEAEQKVKSQMILCLSGLGFCIGSLIREIKEIENEVQELIAWENPTTTQVNVYDVYCKISDLHKI
ncbi:unnamed protein product [Linum tenue]|uniref:Integral membrane bound transporter domain-containing protein n=1 Tax=Linum tenue TaxID=586396 RepID=A0AAV0PL00_9ROSI|nr:unnamed protein product [Linum tenue]